MTRWSAAFTAVLVFCSLGVVAVVMHGDGPAVDPAEVSGAAPDTCFDCKDMRCDACPKPAPCRVVNGYCEETVRNLSQFCAPRPNGEWELCKFRVDQGAACVTRLMNPCTPENEFCATPVDKCGPLGVCIPEGICIP